MYVHVKTDEEYKTYSSKEKVIVKLSAPWCGPCRAIAPYFKELGAEYKDTHFLSVDIDDCDQTAKDLEVTSLPTFVALKEGKEIERFSGASKNKLLDMVRKMN